MAVRVRARRAGRWCDGSHTDIGVRGILKTGGQKTGADTALMATNRCRLSGDLSLMNLVRWKKNDPAEEYRLLLKKEYQRMRREHSSERRVSPLEEVKLRLFLSLLERPRAEEQKSAGGSFVPDSGQTGLSDQLRSTADNL
jgi:hypothetical protein